MAFFNEFPHTRTYDSDLAWLIRRMKEILARMDTLEERMKALEELVDNFINSLHIDEIIAEEVRKILTEELIASMLNTPETVFENVEVPLSDFTISGTPTNFTISKILLSAYKTAIEYFLTMKVVATQSTLSSLTFTSPMWNFEISNNAQSEVIRTKVLPYWSTSDETRSRMLQGWGLHTNALFNNTSVEGLKQLKTIQIVPNSYTNNPTTSNPMTLNLGSTVTTGVYAGQTGGFTAKTKWYYTLNH